MDYNIRAARAGWRGVWACAAFVWRAPFTARRRLGEARRFETSKRLYQDNFCGARLRREKADYRSHCRGDECPNFAPAELIQIRRHLPERTPDLDPPPVFGLQESSGPLVSLIMPTCDRRSFIPQAVRCFQRQDYRNLELVIVDDGVDPISDRIPEDARIRYFRLDHKLTVGAKRNFACAQSRGEFVVHWDDDDWYPARRVRAQISAMAERGADLCGSSQLYFFDPGADQRREIAKLDDNVRLDRAAFSPDESLVAVATAHKVSGGYWKPYRIRIWRAGDGTLAHELRPFERDIYEAVEGLLWWPDGAYLLAAMKADNFFTSRGVDVWSVKSGSHRGELAGCPTTLTGLESLDGGRRLVAGCADGRIRIWDADSAIKQIAEFERSLVMVK